MVSNIDEVIRRWRRQGVRRNPGASASELAELEVLIGAPLPDDVRAYFTAMNGMPDHETEGMLTCFWPIERILREPHLKAGADEFGEFRDIAIADVCIDAWFVRLRVRGSTITVFAEGSALELSSLDAFFARYVADPQVCW